MDHRLTLLTVHAHPDDETITTGGVMARYAAEGLRVACLTCTGGEEGEIVVPELDTPENHARLGEIRREEIRRALERLGPIEHHWLGYRDSGMMDTPANQHAESFWQADLDEAIGRAVRLARELQPDVVVGYNDFGGYGHPDHIRAAAIAKGVFERAGDRAAYPDQLTAGVEPWQPKKLYESVLSLSRREDMQKVFEERGVSSWWMPKDSESDEERAGREAFMQRMADASGPVTTRVDVGDFLDAKHRALEEHVTQLSKDSPFLALSAEDWRSFQPTEDFTLSVSTVGIRIPEDDLFAGLR